MCVCVCVLFLLVQIEKKSKYFEKNRSTKWFVFLKDLFFRSYIYVCFQLFAFLRENKRLELPLVGLLVYKQTYSSEFESPWVPHSYGTLLHMYLDDSNNLETYTYVRKK